MTERRTVTPRHLEPLGQALDRLEREDPQVGAAAARWAEHTATEALGLRNPRPVHPSPAPAPVMTPGVWALTLGLVVREEMCPFYAQSSCIEATRIAQQVAANLGRRIVPVPTWVAVGTRYWWDHQDEPDVLSDPRAWSVGVTGTGAVSKASGKWDGHLVGHLDGALLLDVSGDQFHRPDKGIDVVEPPLFACTRAEIRRGVAFVGQETVFAYREIDSQAWRQQPAWDRNRPLLAQVVAKATVRMREEIALHAAGVRD